MNGPVLYQSKTVPNAARMARTAAPAPGRSGNSRGREKELDSGNPGSARSSDFCNPGQGDAADRQDGSVRRGGDFFQLGNTSREWLQASTRSDKPGQKSGSPPPPEAVTSASV